MWRPTAHKPEAIERFKARRAEAGIGGVVCHALYLVNLAAPDDDDLREVGRRAPRDDRGGERDRGRRGDLPRRLPSRRRVRRLAGAGRRRRSARSSSGCDGDTWLCDGELGRRRRHDRPLDRRARHARRRARPPPAPRDLPRLLPPLRLGLRRPRPRAPSTRSSPRSTRRSASTGCARCTSTTARRRSARTATGTRTSSKARSAKASAPSSPTRRSRGSAPTSRSPGRATGPTQTSSQKVRGTSTLRWTS